MKESGSDIAYITELVSRTPDNFTMLAGSATTFFHALCAGCDGGILALAALLPDACVRMQSLVREQRLAEARALQHWIMPLARSVGGTYGVAGLKAALDLTGYNGGVPRPPLRPALPHVVETIRGQLAALGAFRNHRRESSSNALPDTERILLGPGPSLIPPRVLRAMSAPVLSHLDPDFVPLLTEVGTALRRLFRADDQSLALATSGTGTSAMEAAVANFVSDGMRGVVIVTGYFGDRLAQILERYGANVRRIDVEWGRAVDPQRLRDELRREGADVVGMVHAETSTGVRNPVKELVGIVREHGALSIVDTVTSLGGHEVDLAGWGSRRRVLLRAEVYRRAVGHRAHCGIRPCAPADGDVPQLLSRSEAARGLLGQKQVPPHDVLVAGLRASRGAADD